MSTRSLIAQEQEDGTVKAIYCHSDGYPSYNGAILAGNWTDPAKVAELIAHGDLSSLSIEIGEKHLFSNPHPYGSGAYEEEEKRTEKWCRFYKRDRGEEDVDADVYKSVEDFCAKDFGMVEYIYLMDKQGHWFFFSDNDKVNSIADMALLDLENILFYVTEHVLDGYKGKEIYWVHKRMNLEAPAGKIKEVIDSVDKD